MDKHRYFLTEIFIPGGSPIMRRFAVFILVIVVAYAIFIDISKGTLPEAQEKSDEQPAVTASTTETEPDAPFIEKEVKPGDTVLSIVEKENNGLENVPINVIVTDFSTLNAGLKPEDIKYGQVYKFPTYEHEN